MSADELDDSKAEPRISALGWLANATGSSIAYSGSVPVDLGEE